MVRMIIALLRMIMVMIMRKGIMAPTGFAVEYIEVQAE